MLKQSFKTLSILAAILSLHSVASATGTPTTPAPCTGANCSTDITGSFDFDSNIHLDPDHNGIFLQSNRGHQTAIVDLKNVVMTANGDIIGSATAIGNNMGATLSAGNTVPINHVSQTNRGNNLANVNLVLSSRSVTGEVTLTSVAIGNNFSLSLDNASLSELSAAQCNVGNNTATTAFRWDPTKLTASATAVGNNISISRVMP